MALYYLDHDPQAAARYALDAHLAAGQVCAVTALSNAWHRVNPGYLPLDLKAPYDGLFLRRSSPPRGTQATLQQPNPDPFYEERAGDPTYWLLKGQRIGMQAWEAAPGSLWAAATALQYGWVYAYGVALAHEHKYRFGYFTAALPQLWTLEGAPPHLLSEEGNFTAPVPIVPGDCIVLDEDGCYNTVESYRQYYRLHKQALFAWHRRGEPAWLREGLPGP